MINAYARLWAGMVEQAIDESLRTCETKNPPITMQTIVNARKYIQGEEFPIVYWCAYGVNADSLIPRLRKLWVDLAAHPDWSERYRRIFKPPGGSQEVREAAGRKRIENNGG